MKPTLEYARARDEADVLRTFRERFAIPTDSKGAQLLYLCGHSLGLMPLGARQLVDQELDDWARLGVLGHEHATRPWIPYHENLAAGLAYLSGARPDEVVAMSSLTVNLHLMLASFYRPRGRRVKIRYMTQIKTRPPTFALFAQMADELPDSYHRYLLNGIRDTFGLDGVPLRLYTRRGKNPFDKDDR